MNPNYTDGEAEGPTATFFFFFTFISSMSCEVKDSLPTLSLAFF